MQREKEIRPISASSEYTTEEEQEAIKVITTRCLIKEYIAIGKDKTKQFFFKNWWTEYVFSIKYQKEALNQDVNGSSDRQEPTTKIKSETDDKTSDDQIHQIIG